MQVSGLPVPLVMGALLLVTSTLISAADGVRACATCHPAQAKPQPATSMAHALELVPECKILKDHPIMTFTEGRFSFRIETKGSRSTYSVSDGQQTVSFPIGWAFGQGLAGQTYVFERNGEYFQSRVSYYSAINALDLTLGAENMKPTNLAEATGIPMAPQEGPQCFGCHATNAVEAKKLVPDKMIAGLQCERCHGPTESHLKALTPMPKMATLSTEQTSAFCGQCHRTWDDIASSGKLGVSNVRFQPYRLTNSKCYDTEDVRIRCTTCHNPHEEIDRTASHYDAKCEACHAGGKPAAVACKVATTNCITCHMPKVEIPGSHHQFFDHQIRIVRGNEYPN